MPSRSRQIVGVVAAALAAMCFARQALAAFIRRVLPNGATPDPPEAATPLPCTVADPAGIDRRRNARQKIIALKCGACGTLNTFDACQHLRCMDVQR